MKNLKRTMTILLALLLVISLIPTAVQADESTGLLEESEYATTTGYSVTGLLVSNGVATVTYTTLEEATVVVAIYAEDEPQMVASGTAVVQPGETTAAVTLNGEIPQYFDASAFLVDQYDHAPLCGANATNMYRSDYKGLVNGGTGSGGSSSFDDLFGNGTNAASNGISLCSVIDGTYNSNTNTSSFTGLVSGAEYVLLAVANAAADNLLASDNLLYINQAAAAEDGTLTFTYAVEAELVDVLLCGPTDKNIGDAVITFPEYTANGTLQTVEPTVVYNGQTLVKGQDYVVVGDAQFTEAGSYTCSIRGISGYTGLVECTYTVGAAAVTVPTLTPHHPSLSFEGEVFINVYFNATNIDDVVEMGLATSADSVVDDSDTKIPGYEISGTYYVARTNGIAAKNLGDTIYFRTYAKLADGSYVYSAKTYNYSALDYAKDRLANSTNAKMKALSVAMLNYGAAAQSHFGYNTDNLMNASLTAEQLAMVEAYRSDMVASVAAVDSSKIGAFAYNSAGYTARRPSVSFQGAFAINYYFTPKLAVDDGMTLYYWDQATYNSVGVLTAENASGTIDMELLETGDYTGAVTGISAKDIDATIFVSGVYESNGVSYATGVLPYSLGGYCVDRINNSAVATMVDFAKATAVYGYYAKAYFA